MKIIDHNPGKLLVARYGGHLIDLERIGLERREEAWSPVFEAHVQDEHGYTRGEWYMEQPTLKAAFYAACNEFDIEPPDEWPEWVV